jgi:hypothetical protein
MECGATAFCLVSLRTLVTVFHHGSVLLLNHFVLKLTDPGRIFAVVNALGKPEVRFGIQTVLVSEESTFLLFEIFSPLRASRLAGQFLSSPSTIAGHLPSNLEPATAKFKSLHVGDKFLSSLSVTVEKTNGMMKLHDAVGVHLKRQNIETRSGRFPHMSLFYLDEATPGEC